MTRTVHARSGREDIPIVQPTVPPVESTAEPRSGANIVRKRSAADAAGRQKQQTQDEETVADGLSLPRHDEHERLKPPSEEPDAERILERDRKTLEQASKDAPLEPTKEAVPLQVSEEGKPDTPQTVVAPSPVRRPVAKPAPDPSRTTRQQRIQRSRR